MIETLIIETLIINMKLAAVSEISYANIHDL